MNTFGTRIRPAVDAEMRAARVLEGRGCVDGSFHHLERAHVLGQASTVQHVRTHMAMLQWAWRHRRATEVLGQVLRICGAATKTVAGWVPTGNTGGSNVSPFRAMPVPADLQESIDAARRGAKTHP